MRLPATGPLGSVFVFGGFLLLAISPIVRGGNRHASLIVMEALALLLLLFLAICWLLLPSIASNGSVAAGLRVSKAVLFLALSPLWIGFFQLTPVPSALWSLMPGRDVYLGVLGALQVSLGSWRSVSLIPDATWLSVLAGLPLTAAFLVGYNANQKQLVFLARALVFFASVQAVLGLMQASLFRELYFGAQAYGRAIGTFANPNHLASYINMTLPLTIFLVRLSFLEREAQGHPGGASAMYGHSGSGESVQTWRSVIPGFWIAILFLHFSALLATLSRAGLISGLLISLCCALFLSLREVSGRAVWMRWGGVFLFCIAVSLSVGLDGLIDRIAGSGDESTRWLMIKGSWRAALEFLPFGSGLGTFLGVFPRYQPQELVGFAAHAHSDFIELLMECGLLFLIPAGIALWLVTSRAAVIIRRLRRDPSDKVFVLQASCGLGLLAVFLHSWADFNLRIPANAILAALLMGAFLRPTLSISPAMVRNR